MRINILFFGRLADVTGKNSIELDGIVDTEELKRRLTDMYPGLAQLNYLTAVEREVITANIKLEDKVTVALLPPFSGG